MFNYYDQCLSVNVEAGDVEKKIEMRGERENDRKTERDACYISLETKQKRQRRVFI